jgi:type II secretory pathway predicted ATPase ExeA
MSYKQFYGLKEQPFSITPDPRFFFENEQHADTLVRIQRSIDASRGLTVVIGSMGLGKTFLCRKVFERLQAENSKYEASLLIMIHYEVSADWLLAKIAGQLGAGQAEDDRSVLIGEIRKKLVERYEQGRKSVIIVDEAHMFRQKEIYEEFRGLLNIEAKSQKLLNIVLFGPPELEGFMQLDPPFVSNIGLKITLEPLDERTTEAYINHRLIVAGAEREIFTREACEAVWEATNGIPRLINTICDNALLEAYIGKKKQVTPFVVEKVSDSLGVKKGSHDPNKKKPIRNWYYT